MTQAELFPGMLQNEAHIDYASLIIEAHLKQVLWKSGRTKDLVSFSEMGRVFEYPGAHEALNFFSVYFLFEGELICASEETKSMFDFKTLKADEHFIFYTLPST